MNNKALARYFFALWPDTETAEKLHKSAFDALRASPVSPIAACRLHVTLVYLGLASDEFIGKAQKIASQLQVRPFKLKISQLKQWRHARLLWLGTEQVPGELTQLVRSLQSELVRIGHEPEARDFIPHISIVRQYPHPQWSAKIKPIEWEVKDFQLVRSTHTDQGSVYETVGRWPLQL